MKKLYITNAIGTSGKDTFVTLLDKYIPTYKYSIVDLTKEAAKILGWDGGKTEKDRKFLSDIMDLSSEYNDAPFKDVSSIIFDFYNDHIDTNVLIIDMRDPKDIDRAVEEFDAETILIKNPRVEKITTNHADANVENYNYDYIIENDGTLEQLESVAKVFAKGIICGELIPSSHRPFTITCSKY